MSFAALLVGVLLIPAALGVAKIDHDQAVSQLELVLAATADEHSSALETYFARARSSILLTANSPAFASVLAERGARAAKVRRNGRNIREVTHQLAYLQQLYPAIGETCFIDARGEEFVRVVHGEVARPGDLSTREEKTVFFAPTFALKFGQVHQTRPYVSPDTHEWVVANATLIPQPDGRKRAIAHFEVTIESFRRALGAAGKYELRVVDAKTGHVVIDGDTPQRVGAELGVRGERSFAAVARHRRQAGSMNVDGRLAAYRRIPTTVGNANDWLVVARVKTPLSSFISGIGPVPLSMLAVALAMVALAGASLRARRRELEAHAATDALTGLGNRRKLLRDLARCMKAATREAPIVLTLFDLNGFKDYNDSFGHPAGDALLLRLGRALAEAVRPFGGVAYRPGGDEFCVIAGAQHQQTMEEVACRALSEQGEGFSVSSAFGSVVIPRDTSDMSEALRKADLAMYGQKHSGRATAGRQSSAVLLCALAERHPELGDHQEGVAELASAVGERLGIEEKELGQLRQAAALHDIGKVAVPDAIINKPSRLTGEEWAFMRRHTLIGERIVSAAPALCDTAQLIRSSHEAWDGSGYPDGLAGVEIPLGSRIIAVCDAFDAMIAERPYAAPKTTDEALAELRSCSGTQFDPAVVDVVLQVIADRARSPVAGTPA